MQVHAAMIDRIDQGIGDLVQALKETGQFENTVIFFLCDNGASPEILRKPGFDRHSQTRDGRKVEYENELDDVGPETTSTGIGPAWANACNTPFRFWKKESFEGGVHTPLVVHWPNGLKFKGYLTNQVGHVMDIMPTCLELADASYPSEYNGHQITPLEGKSLLPILQGGEREGHEVLYFEHEGGRAVRMGDWKLVALRNKEWELYDLSRDKTEMNNLAEKFPEKVKALNEKWIKWAQRVGAPTPAEK